ncbi:YciI family protein [Dactylosporangium salmoneum]|uniref:YCII-related domain-containing protein n=1 Tax=Dactylosporangium salmoneum TaxID=53361 RepID=A0ABN3FQL5_9ACTN
MTQYAILLFTPAPADPADLPPAELQAHLAHAEEAERLGGRIVAGYGLQPSTTATAVRGDTVTDGPFIEAKEVVAGFYILEARDLDHALEIARRNPATWRGGVEIRPLFA